MRLSVFGHTTLDYIVNLERLPAPNTSIEMKDQQRFFGGTGANIARRSSHLGVKTCLSSFVGEDFPQDFTIALKKSGVDITDLNKVPGYLSPMCWIMSDPDHNQIAVINQGPVRDSDDFEITTHSIKKADIIHICTGRPGYYQKVITEAHQKGKKIGFDPSQEIHYVYTPEIFKEMLALSDYFFCNDSELRKALKYTGDNTGQDLLSEVEILVATQGKDGSTIYTEGETLNIPIVPPSKVVDTTGAGDAYRAGFYAGMNKKLDLYNCGLMGAVSSSFAIEEMGPQNSLPSWDDLKERLEKTGLS